MRNLHKNLTGLLLLGLVLSTSTMAQSYFNSLHMGQMGSSHSIDVALGGSNTSVYSSAFNTFTNPANQGGFKGLDVTGSFSLLNIKENRSYAAIDQFADRVTDNIYVVSRGGQNGFAGGFSWGNGMLGVSAVSMPFSTPAFFFKEEIRGSLYSPNINRDPLVGYHHTEQKGMIQASGTSVGSAFGSWSVGAGVRVLHGMGLENQYGISIIDSADISPLAAGETALENETWELSNSPVIVNLGLIKDLGMHWRISASYQTPYALESTRRSAIPVFEITEDFPLVNWASDTIDLAINVPAQLELGLRMKPSNPLPTAVYFSLVYQDWSQYELTYSDSLGGELSDFEFPLQETFSVRGGLEHWVSDNVPFRAGFVWAESPLAGELAQTRFSAGSGWVSGPLKFDVAVQLFSVRYKSSDIFVPINMSPHNSENISETQTMYSISMSYSL